MPAKPTKYGIKVWIAADATNGFMVNHSVYLGKEPGQAHGNGLGYDVVINLIRPFFENNNHVFFDNSSHPKLLEDLLAHKTYAYSNSKGVPTCSKQKLKKNWKAGLPSKKQSCVHQIA